MKYTKLFEEFLNEKKPKGAPDWHDSDAPDANGKFKELGIKDLAAWLIKTRKKDLKKITGSLNQQIVFNKNDDPEYAKKMDKVRDEVYRQLGREDLLKENDGERDVLAELNEMTLGQLERIADYADMIKERMQKGEQLESWMYSQLTVALENLNSVHDAMDGNDGVVEADKKPGPDAYMTGLDDETKKEKEKQMKKQTEMDDDDNKAYKELPGDEEAREEGRVKTSKHVKKYHELYGESVDEAKEQSTDRSPIDSEEIEKALKKKSDETGVPIGIIRAVMRRGMAAWKTGHRPGATEQQWGYSRVNSFLTKSEGTWGGADKDLAKEVRDGGHDKKLKS